MTNLEFYKDEIKKEYLKQGFLGDALFIIAKRNGYKYGRKDQYLIDWLLEEHKEKIKLKKWEYDLIRSVNWMCEFKFESFNIYQNMKKLGHFKGVTNTSMTLKEILENCEIVD